MNRRALLRMPAALGVPLAAQTQAAQAPAPPNTPAAAAQDTGFDPHQTATLETLAGLIIPGSPQAGVVPYMIALLRDGPAPTRQFWNDGLNWLDGYALATRQAPFIKVPAAQQIPFLEALEASTAPELEPGRAFLSQAKPLVARVFIATRPGFNEINKGGRVPATYACQHPGKEHA